MTLDGERCTVAPKISMIDLRNGFVSYEERVIHTSHSMSNRLQANASAVPHCPAPVSVVSFFTPDLAL